jgi:hypothetical protein
MKHDTRRTTNSYVVSCCHTKRMTRRCQQVEDAIHRRMIRCHSFIHSFIH